MPLMILTIVGPDRPGLVRGIAAALTEAGGNWLESRLSRLAGHFAGMALVEAPEAFLRQLPALETQGLRVTASPAAAAPAVAMVGPRLRLEAVTQDRPGILREVSAVLAKAGANIEEMTTTVEHAAFSGEVMFRAVMVLRVPSDAAAGSVTEGLEELSNDMVVDVQSLDA